MRIFFKKNLLVVVAVLSILVAGSLVATYTYKVQLAHATTPTLSSVSIAIASQGGVTSSTTRGRVGDIITLSFTANTALQLASVTSTLYLGGIGMASTTMSTSTSDGGTTWTAKYWTKDADTAGAVTFMIDFSSNDTGTAGTQVTAVTNGTTVYFDKAVPTLSPVSIVIASAGNMTSSTTRGRQGDLITLTFTGSEALDPQSVSSTLYINSVATAIKMASSTVSGLTAWTATYTTASTDANGAVTFGINFNDLAGNAGTLVTAVTNGTAVVFDKAVPTLSPVSIVIASAGNMTSSTTRGRQGDVITLTFTGSEALDPQSVSSTLYINSVATAIKMASSTVSGLTAWTATYTTASSDANGAVTFGINFNDLAGNAGTIVTAVTNGTAVVFDKAVPTLSPVSIVIASASNMTSSTTRGRQGDVITLTFTGSEALDPQSVSSTLYINSVATAIKMASSTVSGLTAWTATYTTASSDANGAVSFGINFNDLAGNAGTQVTAVTNGTAVVFDKAVPTLSTVAIASNYSSNAARAKVGHIITLTFTGSEALDPQSVSSTLYINSVATAIKMASSTVSGLTAWTATYTAASTDVNGAVTFDINFNDLAGNAGTRVTAVTTGGSSVTFDKTAPTLTSVSITSNSGNVSMTAAGSIVTLSFTSSETAQTTSTPAVSFYSGGVAAANASSPSNISGNNWTSAYTVVGADETGAVTFAVNFTDLAGNAGTQVVAVTDSSSVTIVRAASSGGGGGGGYTPVVVPTSATVAINSGAQVTASRTVTLAISAQNAAQMAISNLATFADASYELYAVSKTWMLTSGDGQKMVYVKFLASSGGTTVASAVITLNESAAPATPATPATPAAPATPATPATPAIPATPAAPATPATPAPEQPVTAAPSGVLKLQTPAILQVKLGKSLSYGYSFANQSGKTLKIKLQRTVTDLNGKVTLDVTGTRTLAKSKSVSLSLKAAVAKNAAPGNYTVSIKVLNLADGALLDQGSFAYEVLAPVPSRPMTADDIVFTLPEVISFARGASFNYGYIVTNSTGAAFKAKATRQIIDPSGKIILSSKGNWSFAEGEVITIKNLKRSIVKNAALGIYTVAVRLYDLKGALLAEKSFEFEVK